MRRLDPAGALRDALLGGDTAEHHDRDRRARQAAMLSSGTILVTDGDAFGGAGGVIAVDPAGGRQTALSQGGMFSDPTGVAILRDGGIVVSDTSAFGTGGLIRVDPGTGQQTKIVASTVFREPFGLAVDSNNQVLVAYGQNAVMRVNPANGDHHAVGPGFQFSRPLFVAVDAAGTVIVAEPGSSGLDGRLLRIDASGAVVELNVNPPPNGAIYAGVVVDLDSSALVANSFRDAQAVLRVNPATGAATTVSHGDKLGFIVIGIALEPDGNILVITSANGLVRINRSTGAQSVLSNGGLFSHGDRQGPLDVAVVK